MGRGRLEAFSDGVIAIIITIMVLELEAPHGADLAALRPLAPKVLGYVLSFVYVGIYWNNHHHLLHTVDRIGGWVLWANLHLLFWLSLIPFATAWMGQNQWAALPTAMYGGVLLMAALAWMLLEAAIEAQQGPDSALRRAVGGDWKEQISAAAYLAAVLLAFVRPALSIALYMGVAMLWFVPDRRIEAQLGR